MNNLDCLNQFVDGSNLDCAHIRECKTFAPLEAMVVHTVKADTGNLVQSDCLEIPSSLADHGEIGLVATVPEGHYRLTGSVQSDDHFVNPNHYPLELKWGALHRAAAGA